MLLRTAFFLGLLGLMAAAPATAHQLGWPFWLSRPEHHGHRKLAGDFTHINTTYRYHSRERHGLLSFLHLNGRRPVTARRRGQAAKAGHKHTTGLF